MKKIGIITFHMAHNYGSMLQAWALQHTLIKLGYSVEIIDYQNRELIHQYRIFPAVKKWKNLIRNLIYVFYFLPLRKKHQRFIDFANRYFQRSRCYHSYEEIQTDPPQYTDYITGSDQVWNFSSGHTDDAYYLAFVRTGNKISYAASFGPLDLCDDVFYQEKIKTHIASFHAISVREEKSAELIQRGLNLTPDITLDPTLLIAQKEYERLIQGITPPKGKYIFFYTLGPTQQMIEMVKKIADALQYRVVISKFNNEIDLMTPFEKRLETGPLEFLCMLKNAALVITSSYHATVFSIKFERPFFAINGMSDHRISTLLKIVNLTERAITYDTVEEKIQTISDVDFEGSRQKLQAHVEQSITFLKNSLKEENEQATY